MVSLFFDNAKPKYLGLMTAISNLLSNFLSETSFRHTLIQDRSIKIFGLLVNQLKSVESIENARVMKWIECTLAVFVNLSYQAKEQA